MEKCIRFGISLPQDLLKRFDAVNHEKGYPNRSEAVRDLIRGKLIETGEWADPDSVTAGTVILVYDHHKKGVVEKLMEQQHEHHSSIISTMHAHLDHDNCIEVILLKGKNKEIRKLADKLSSAKNVKMGKFVPATTGTGID